MLIIRLVDQVRGRCSAQQGRDAEAAVRRVVQGVRGREGETRAAGLVRGGGAFEGEAIDDGSGGAAGVAVRG